jgi:hypothetical protein
MLVVCGVPSPPRCGVPPCWPADPPDRIVHDLPGKPEGGLVVDASVVIWTGLLGSVLSALIALGAAYLGMRYTRKNEEVKRAEDRMMQRESRKLAACQDALTILMTLDLATIASTSWRSSRPKLTAADSIPVEINLRYQEALEKVYSGFSLLSLVVGPDLADTYRQAIVSMNDLYSLAKARTDWDSGEYKRLLALGRGRRESFIKAAREHLSHISDSDRLAASEVPSRRSIFVKLLWWKRSTVDPTSASS